MKKSILLLFIILISFFIFACSPKDDANDNNDDKEKTDDPIIIYKNEKVDIKLGIDLIDDNLELFKNKRVGLITNATGVNSDYKSTIDILYEKVNLVALFAPEHGIRGAASAGEGVGNETDQVTGLPIYSLYGSVNAPTKAMMDEIDILCIDIQDVGARFYTYIYTMSRSMESCAKYNKPFVVFDRPNPVSGAVFEGNILDMNYSSGIGKYSILQRHGMTIGEIADYFNVEEKINCDLTVIKMKDWKREYYLDDTNCPWILPSPNMPTLDTALVYTGTCIFEGTNLSEGRGTTRPFELIGAPWIDSIALANRLNSMNLASVYFRPAAFTPSTSKHSGTTCYGVQVHVLDRSKFESVKTGWTMFNVIREMYPNDLSYTSTFNKLAGCSYLKDNTYTLNVLYEILKTDTNTFAPKRAKHLFYE